MRTEVRRGVPWPAWVVEYRARKRDQIGVAGTDDGFGLLKLGNKPDSEARHQDRRNAFPVFNFIFSGDQFYTEFLWP
jgi:hypothetical protein